jgi:hypothetical protein
VDRSTSSHRNYRGSTFGFRFRSGCPEMILKSVQDS